MTRFDGLTDDWILQKLREGAVTTHDLQKAYEHDIAGYPLTEWQISPFKERAYRRLRILEKRGHVERCGKCQLLYTRYMTWRIIE